MNELMEILEKEGIESALKALDGYNNYRIHCLFLADVAESVLHIFECAYPDNKRLRLLIDGVRDFYVDNITIEGLNRLRFAAYSHSHIDAATAAVGAAFYVSIHDAVLAAVEASALSAVEASKNKKQKWEEIKDLFIKRFGEKQMKKTNEVTITLHVRDIDASTNSLLDDAKMCIEQEIYTGRLEKGGDSISWKTKEVEEEA